MHNISLDLMRAYAQYTPDGRPVDIGRENYRGLCRLAKERAQKPETGINKMTVPAMLRFAIVRLRPRNLET